MYFINSSRSILIIIKSFYQNNYYNKFRIIQPSVVKFLIFSRGICKAWLMAEIKATWYAVE